MTYTEDKVERSALVPSEGAPIYQRWREWKLRGRNKDTVTAVPDRFDYLWRSPMLTMPADRRVTKIQRNSVVVPE